MTSAPKQTTNTLLMIRPVNFGFNDETAASNAFQHKTPGGQNVQQKALAEFDNFVNKLKANDVDVLVISDTLQPHTPDSIFPNNWISFHQGAQVVLYPMQAENRRLERKEGIISQLKHHFNTKKIVDLSYFEQQNQFLEGTGSMVLDRENQLAYACLSPRTHPEVLAKFCMETGYTPVVFQAFDARGLAIYHTNVLMCIASHFAVICLGSIKDKAERDNVINTIEESGKELIEISLEQMNQFAGNMLEVNNRAGKSLTIMSTSAYRSLNEEQLEAIEHYSRIIHSDLSTIEANGGGSARCMMTEVFV